jgi:hypothetical protein
LALTDEYFEIFNRTFWYCWEVCYISKAGLKETKPGDGDHCRPGRYAEIAFVKISSSSSPLRHLGAKSGNSPMRRCQEPLD